MSELDVQRVMAVDDDAALLQSLEAILEDEVDEFKGCQNVTSAVELLARWTPDLILLDFSLPDGNAFDVLKALGQKNPTPLIVAMSGAAIPSQSFRLAKLGVRTYLSKPFTASELRKAMEKAIGEPIDIRPYLRNIVGQRSIHDVEEEVRDTLLDEALARAKGSRRGAAKLLNISRQLIQHMLRRRQDK